MCTSILCYTLHSSWDSQVCVPLTSRYLLCVYVCRVLWLRFPVPRTCRTILQVYRATHCTVHGIRGYACHLLRGICFVCTFVVWYGCASLCPERVVLCVQVYCATHCIVHRTRGYLCHLLRSTCSVCTFAGLCINVSYCMY